MADTNYNWSNLIDKYLRKEITPEEMEALRRQMNDPLKQEQFDRHTNVETSLQTMRNYYKIDIGAARNKLKAMGYSLGYVPGKRIHWGYAIAAITIGVILLAGLYFLFRNEPSTPVKKELAALPKKGSGDKKAAFPTLKLYDGRQFVLGTTGKPDMIVVGNAQITYENGMVQVASIHTENDLPELAGNTLTSPAGQSISLRLIDKSYLKLNSASSVTFPIAFSGNERRLEATGEVFFDITKNPKKPCVVKTGNLLQILVFGTRFNVSNYRDEEFNTTLINGRIKIAKGNKKYVLKPGQRARLVKDEIVVDAVNVNSVIAWTRNELDLNCKNIKEVLMEVGRKYNKEVVFNGSFSDSTFDVRIPFSKGLPRILETLQELNHIRIKDSCEHLIATSLN